MLKLSAGLSGTISFLGAFSIFSIYCTCKNRYSTCGGDMYGNYTFCNSSHNLRLQ